MDYRADIDEFLTVFHQRRETYGLVHVTNGGFRMVVRYDWAIHRRDDVIAGICREDFVGGPFPVNGDGLWNGYRFRVTLGNLSVVVLLSLGRRDGPGICWEWRLTESKHTGTGDPVPIYVFQQKHRYE